jgi:hypothetical protein
MNDMFHGPASWLLTSSLFTLKCNGELRRQYQRESREFPTMEEFLKLHEGGETYTVFITEIVKRVVGESVWSKNCTKKLVSEFVTKSDEAFALVTIENHYDRWSYMYAQKDKTDKDRTAPYALYTNCGNTKGGNGTNRKYDGWSREGLDRFNKLHQLVTEDRTRASRVKFEEGIRAELEANEASKKHRKKVALEDPMGGAYPAHDFEDVAGLPFSSSKKDGDDDASSASAAKSDGEEENGSDQEDDGSGDEDQENNQESDNESGDSDAE